MRFITVFAMGPGESSQAYAFIKYVLEKFPDIKINFCLGKKINQLFFSDVSSLRLSTFLTVSPEELGAVVAKGSELVVLFNSKSFSKHPEFQNDSPFPNVPTYTVDSNWLFDPVLTRFPFVRWATKYLVNLPEEVYLLGYRENGGYFSVPADMREKIQPIGLIPSYEKISTDTRQAIRRSLSIPEGAKFIFCYFSGFGAGERSWVLENLQRAMANIENNQKVEIRYLGLTSEPVGGTSYTAIQPVSKETISPDRFYEVLSSADLVFQHQGLGTLSQSICANVPVIANVAEDPVLGDLSRLHEGEVRPFAELGACQLLNKIDSLEKIVSTINSLLWDDEKIQQMKDAQEKINIPGELNLVRELSLI